MVFLLGLDGGLPGNNQSEQRLEADEEVVKTLAKLELKYLEATWRKLDM